MFTPPSSPETGKGSALAGDSHWDAAPPRKLEIGTGEGLFYLFVCGSKGAGKTALITRYCQSRFPKWYDPIDVNHHSVETIFQHQCLFEFVELDGADELDRQGAESCTDGFQAMNGLILVYDVGDRQTFTALPEIYQKILDLSNRTNVPVTVVANKDDMFQHSREVRIDEGRELAEAIGGMFGQCTAREGDGVREMIQQTMKSVLKARLKLLEDKDEQLLREKSICQQEEEQDKPPARVRAKRSMSARMISRLSFGKA